MLNCTRFTLALRERLPTKRIKFRQFRGVSEHGRGVYRYTLRPSGANDEGNGETWMRFVCGGSSVVEHLLAKERVAGSNPVRRSKVKLKNPRPSVEDFLLIS